MATVLRGFWWTKPCDYQREKLFVVPENDKNYTHPILVPVPRLHSITPSLHNSTPPPKGQNPNPSPPSPRPATMLPHKVSARPDKVSARPDKVAATMSPDKVCDYHKNRRPRTLLRCCACLLITIFLILLAILLTWAILRPMKPRFVLQDVTVFSLNVSAPNVISTSVQVTVASRNPNRRIGIYYDKMYVYATFHDQQISFFTVVPPVYQGDKDVNVWSPFVYGTDVPVAPYNGIALSQVQGNGTPVEMTVKIDGRLKWKVGSFTSGRYHIHVACPVSIPLGNGKNSAVVVGGGVKYQISQQCSVSV